MWCMDFDNAHLHIAEKFGYSKTVQSQYKIMNYLEVNPIKHIFCKKFPEINVEKKKQNALQVYVMKGIKGCRIFLIKGISYFQKDTHGNKQSQKDTPASAFLTKPGLSYCQPCTGKNCDDSLCHSYDLPNT